MKTNRPHFSWSQYSLFKASKVSFYKRYVLGETSPPNKYFDKGKELGRYLEKGEIPHWVTDPLLEPVGATVPRLDIMEEKMLIDLFKDVKADKLPEWRKPLLMFTDTSKEDGSVFYEYKTGKIPWDQHKVDAHKQLDFYAVGYYARTGAIPKCKLIWIETEEVEEPDQNGELQSVIRYTGLVEQFTREFTIESISNMTVSILSVMHEISEWEYTEIELTGEDDFTERYVDLLNKQTEIKEELAILKLAIYTRMDSEKMERASGEFGTFAVSKRKSFDYSPKLTKLKATYDSEIKRLQIEEKNEGVAKESYSESIRFTIKK